MSKVAIHHYDGSAPSRKRIGLRRIFLVGVGALALAVLSFLPGCGSDSTPGGSVKGKNAPTPTKSWTKPPGVSPLLIGQEETGPVKMGLMAKPPDSGGIVVFPGVTKEEIEAKVAADRKEFEAPGTEVLPGITREQLEARVAADRTKFYSERNEIFPNMTLEQLKSKQATEGKPDPRHMLETMPGATQR